MQYAVVEIAGKQYLVSPSEKIKIEKLPSQKKSGLKLDKILLAGEGEKVEIGKPYVSGTEVEAEILGERRSKKVIVFRYKSKTRARVKKGHRQYFTEILIKNIKTS